VSGRDGSDIVSEISILRVCFFSRKQTLKSASQASRIGHFRTLGREQGVQYLLEGSVRKAGNRVRVSCQLIDAGTGLHMYADRFDRELDDIFQVQDEITQKVTVELQVHLTSGEQARMWAGGTKNISAWESALKADELMARHIREENNTARSLAQNAVSLDPEYAAAWTTLGMTYWQDARWGWSVSREDSLKLAEEAAQEAERIDRNYPGIYTLLGMVNLTKGQHDLSVKMMERAVDLAPSHAASVSLYAFSLHLSMRPDECIRQIKRAIHLCPIYPSWYLVPMAGSYLQKEQPQFAHDALKLAIESGPESILARVWQVITLVDLDRPDEAKELAGQILDHDPGFSTAVWSGGLEFKDTSWNSKLERNLREAGLPE
jgi:adenylate cyclase